jgi:eukaryotic-like serine/threonine-protein kinase
MPIVAGARLEHYEIISLLGAGGMGEVWRARDPRLDRQVAIKFLRASLANSADGLPRFRQEALTTSALNHPNILTVYDIGSHEGAPFIVAELLEGKELRELMREGPIAPRKVVEYARQIADGLAAAHSKGVVHRDLKPENLFLTKEGRVKILDFGLAKLKPQEVGAANSQGPTQRKITEPGTVMGTVGYMSPEQVRGQEADNRSDIFSFGTILYEMLSGERAFNGVSAADVMSAILKEEPPELTAINSKVPAQLERVVSHCLEKRPDERFQSARDLAFALNSLSTTSGSQLDTEATSPELRANSGPARWFGRERLAWIGLSVLLLASLPIALAYLRRSTPTNAHMMNFSILPPEKTSFDDLAVSPDGRWLAFTATTGGRVQLWVRAFDVADARLLAGTDGASYPFWSPDSRFIAFFVPSKLKKIEVTGGLPATICDVGIPTGGAWSRDGVILFSALGGVGVLRVSSTGGEARTVIRLDFNPGEADPSFPCFLPDGRHFLYTKGSARKEIRGIYLASLDGQMNERLLADGSKSVYAASGGASNSAGGHVLFGREGALMAQPFDAEQRRLTGEPFTIAEHVRTALGNQPSATVVYPSFSVSDTGTMVYDPLPDRQRNQLVWVDRGGRRTGSLDGIDKARNPRLSPDDRRFAVARDGNNVDLWLSDVTGGNVTRFTFDPANDQYPVWSPDGSRIVWASSREGIYHLYQKAANLSGQDELLLKSDHYKFPTDWSRDGRFIIYRELDPKTKQDVWVLPLGPQTTALASFPFLRTEANEAAAVLSPDGNWIAYNSDESGKYEVYVQSFSGGGGKRQVSTGGGLGPRWRGDGKELFYHAADGRLMAVPVKIGAGFDAGTAAPLFEFRAGGNLITPYYDVTRDGQKFLLATIVESVSNAPLTVVVNWAQVNSR